MAKQATATGNTALRAMLEQYAPGLYSLIYSILGNRWDSDDAFQTLVENLLRRENRSIDIREMKGFLFTSARNAAMDVLRGRQRGSKMAKKYSQFQLLQGPEKDEGAFGDETERINEALAELPTEQREVIIMKVYHDLTFQEIANSTRAPLSTTHRRYELGMSKLQEKLK